MTYCVGLKIDRGIVFAADTRTNAGVDNVARFKKMTVWDAAADRTLVLLAAGNLAISQSIVTVLNEQIEAAEEGEETLHSANTMFQAARLVGNALRAERSANEGAPGAKAETFSASFVLGGQIRGEPPRLFQIYAEGNFIEASGDTPYFQIGEHKYGKPILDRVAAPTMRMGEAAKLLLLSFDSTIRSNLSVGLPIDIAIYRNDTFHIGEEQRIGEDNVYFRALSEAWSDALRRAFDEIKGYPDQT